ncbi:hypothetical protein PVAND_015775 [Polypedilum vanderplanki]|uniref:Uncharacterized protein n=1 Tax=Polypedilum vanderplanki TaxID=319348 RepID=A0A9J6BE45_POLVA|nr:hypothetical protein PVAND_015775 [Polypedilum vanderplanki]
MKFILFVTILVIGIFAEDQLFENDQNSKNHTRKERSPFFDHLGSGFGRGLSTNFGVPDNQYLPPASSSPCGQTAVATSVPCGVQPAPVIQECPIQAPCPPPVQCPICRQIQCPPQRICPPQRVCPPPPPPVQQQCPICPAPQPYVQPPLPQPCNCGSGSYSGSNSYTNGAYSNGAYANNGYSNGYSNGYDYPVPQISFFKKK